MKNILNKNIQCIIISKSSQDMKDKLWDIKMKYIDTESQILMNIGIPP